MDKRTGWNDNEASRDERKQPEDNWLTHPAHWDICDKHETVFPMGEACSGCLADQEAEL